MYRSNKKGFTIVELVIVIAVVAILAAVLIPTFASLVKKANASKDVQTVRDLNTAIAVYVNEAITGEEATVVDAIAAAKEFGYDVAKINAKADGNEILWDSVNGVFCYFNENKVEYVPEFPGKTEITEDEYEKYWVIDDEISTVYSTYYYGSDIDSDTTTEICIATDGADLTVNAPNANVYHYGDVANLTIEAVASASYHEFGRVTQLAIVKKGHVKVEATGSIGALVVATAEVKLTGDFGLVMGTEEVLADADIPEEVKTQAVESADDLDGVVAIVDGAFYADMKEAFAAANGKVIVLVRDVEYAANTVFTIAKEQVITLDLNGHAIMATAGESAVSNVITNNGKLTIKDSVGGGKITTNALNPDKQEIPGFASNTIANKGELVLESGTIENTTSAGAAYPIDCYQGSTFTMNGGKLVAARCALRMFCNSDTIATTVVINDGVIEGGTRGIWIHLPGSSASSKKIANLTINGGTITGKSDNDCALYSYSFGDSFANTNVTITGGTFNGLVAFGGGYKGDVENVTITGGTFNGSLGRYLDNDGWEDIAKPQ